MKTSDAQCPDAAGPTGHMASAASSARRPPGGFRRVGIIGLGLMGGSLARELASRGARVLGWDRDAESVRAAIEEGVIAGTLGRTVIPESRNAGAEASLLPGTPALAGLDDVDAAILAVPPEAAVQLLTREAERLARRLLVMDVTSTKRAIVRRAASLGLRRFVGAHPLAGSERCGWAASRLGLITGAPVYLCAHEDVDPEALQLAETFWGDLGCRPERIDAAGHDARLAWTSHLPQMASTALGLVLADNGVERAALGPGGRDVTRLAGSAADLWTGIAMENRDLLAPALVALEARLGAMRQALEEGNRAALHRAFRDAADWTDPEGRR